MDARSGALADALAAAGARAGFRVSVNEASPPPGAVVVTLGVVRGDLLGMIRQGMPSEGGLRTLNHPDVSLPAGRLPAATLAWIDAWAAELRRIARHEAALAEAGLPAHGLLPGVTVASEVAVRLAAAGGRTLRERLSDAPWRMEACGFEAAPDPDDRGRAELRVDRLGMRGLDLGVGRAVRVTEGAIGGDGATTIRIATEATLPEAALAAAPGRDVADLVELPGVAGRTGWRVTRAAHGMDVDEGPYLEIGCQAPTTTLD